MTPDLKAGDRVKITRATIPLTSLTRSAIGPGDWVECVDDKPDWCIPTGLVAGRAYLVDALTPMPMDGIMRGLILRGVYHPGNNYGAYNPRRFRPIYRPKADFIESLKQPAPETPRIAEPAQ